MRSAAMVETSMGMYNTPETSTVSFAAGRQNILQMVRTDPSLRVLKLDPLVEGVPHVSLRLPQVHHTQNMAHESSFKFAGFAQRVTGMEQSISATLMTNLNVALEVHARPPAQSKGDLKAFNICKLDAPCQAPWLDAFKGFKGPWMLVSLFCCAQDKEPEDLTVCELHRFDEAPEQYPDT